jgi:HEAT repeat protein
MDAAAQDATAWQYWWALNREPYLRLKSHLHKGGPTTEGGEERGLGRGERKVAGDRLTPSEGAIRQMIVPALVRALENETQNDIVTAAMVALAKIGYGENATDRTNGPRVGEVIKRFLGSPSQEIAETAAVSLGILADPADLDLLVALLEDDGEMLKRYGAPIRGQVPTRTRAFAAYGLGLLGQGMGHGACARINNACARLVSSDARFPGAREVQVACLQAIRLTPLPLGEADREESAKVPSVLMTRQDQLRWLLAVYDDERLDLIVRAQAPAAASRLLADLPQDFPLRAAIAERWMRDLARAARAEGSLQASCALALGEIGRCDADALDKRITGCLMDAVEFLADHQTRRFALIALGRIAGRPGAVGNPIEQVISYSPATPNIRRFLGKELAKGRGTIPQWAALAIAVGERGLAEQHQPTSGEMAAALRTALADAGNPDECGAFAIAIGIVGDRSAYELLLKNLNDLREIEARGFTALALGMIDEKSAMKPIQEIVKASRYQPDLMRSAAIGLGLLGDNQLVPQLLEMLGQAQGLASQASICSALGMIGDARSIAPLIAMLENREITASARAFAAAALGIVAERGALPWNTPIAVDVNYRANTPTLIDGQSGVLDIL